MANQPRPHRPRRPDLPPPAPRRGAPLAVALVALALVAATAAVYAPTARNGFVSYDDDEYVYNNPHVRDGLSWAGLRWAFVEQNPDGRWQFNSTAANWHPLTWLAHMTNVSLFGSDPAGAATRLGLTLPVPGWHHLSALLFHLANTVLLFLLLRRLTGRLWPPALVAALFALHPLHAESVAWISERKDLLSTLFLLLTLWAYVAWTAPRSPARYLLVLLLFALGLLAKPMLVTLPFLLLLLDFWPLGRFSPSPPVGWHGLAQTGHDEKIGSVPIFRLLLEKLPFFLLAVPSCYLTWLAQARGQALATLAATPWSFRWQNALLAPVRYLEKTFWPADLSFSYQKSAFYPPDGSVPWWWTAGAAALLLTITALVLFAALRHGRRYLAVGWFWFLGTLVPVLGLVQVGSQVMADRYTYIPLIGLFIILAGLAAELADVPRRVLSRRAEWPTRAVLFAVCLAVLSALGLATFAQTACWHDNLALYSHALAVNPRDDKAHLNLGSDFLARYEAGGPPELLDQAARHYRQILDSDPSYPQALCDLARVSCDLRRYPEALDLYRQALRLKPDFPEAHNNLGTALTLSGDHDAAIREYAAALAQNPDYGAAHFNLAHELILQALALPPEKKDLFQTLVAGALDHYAQAIRLQTNPAQAHYELGWTFAQLNRLDLALPELLAAARLDPRHHDALVWAALIMSAAQDDRLRDGPLALRCIDQAIKLAGTEPPPEDLNVLAIALAACGRFDQAAALSRQLLDQALAARNLNLAAELQNNLRSFDAHQPLRRPSLALAPHPDFIFPHSPPNL